MVAFGKGERKDDVAAAHLKRFGKARKGCCSSARRRRRPRCFAPSGGAIRKTGKPYPWLVRSTAMVNHFYFYCVDRDFGPFFLKFCTYFPVQREAVHQRPRVPQAPTAPRTGSRYEALDNGIASCAEPKRAQAICDKLSAHAKIDALLRKWLRPAAASVHRRGPAAGYRYDLSILQAEFSLTQVLDRPVSGRAFFEEVIRENLDIGRPDQVQLIFERRRQQAHAGAVPHPRDHRGRHPLAARRLQSSRIKQYHKEGRALRTETTINNTRDFGIGKRI